MPNKRSQKIAIVGAGVAGLAAAYGLRDAAEVVVFEKSRGVSGRAATRGRHGVRYDHGANYFRMEAPRVAHLVLRVLPTDELAEIAGDVWTFDGAGRLSPGDPDRNLMAKWTYRSGISTLGKLLLRASCAALQSQTRVGCLEKEPAGWRLYAEEGHDLGVFEAVLLTPPAPQTADLLDVSSLPGREHLVAALRRADYRTQLSFVLAFDRPLPRPGDFYALVNTDGAHEVAWVGFEEDKPGHVPLGQSVLVVQMSPAWSRPRYEASLEELQSDVLRAVGALLGEALPAPAWADLQRWRYALPNGAADVETLREAEADGLFFAGDGLAGKGRVALAVQNGLEAAARLAALLD